MAKFQGFQITLVKIINFGGIKKNTVYAGFWDVWKQES